MEDATNEWDWLDDDYVPPPVAADRKCPEHNLGTRRDGVSFIRGCTAIGPRVECTWGAWREIVPVQGDPAFCTFKEPETRQ